MIKRVVNPPSKKGQPGRYVVIGANGQLGTDLVRTFSLPGELIPLTRAELDVTDAEHARQVLTEIQPTTVLNTAAYNKVDLAEEDEGYQQALAVNALAAGDLAAICKDLGAAFVHFSTDYVFDGRKKTPYLESDPAKPVNRYGETKLAGENLARERSEKTFIFRVCGLFGIARSAGKGGTNFVETMLRLAREGRPLRVVSDQVLTPSYALDVARKVWEVLPSKEYAIYHLTNAGQTSWFEFAKEIFRLEGLSPDLKPVTSAEFGAKAKRPPYSVLAHGNLRALDEDDLRPWKEALKAYLEERQGKVPA